MLQLKCSFQDSSLPLNKREGRGHVFHRGISYLISSVQILGYDYEPDDRVESRLTSDVVKYVLIVSRKLTSELKAEGVGKLTEEDQQALRKLTKFLDSHSEYNGATGITTRRRGEGFDRIRESLEQSSCRFLVKNWTIIIRNSGQIHQDTNDVSQSGWYQECNIAERVFSLRKEVFLSLRWRAESGSMSHLDFFVRSNEALKIPKLSECFFLPELSYTDTPIQPKTGSYMKARPKGYRSRETQKIMAENTEAYLTPEDIPCSSVRNGEDISKWTIPQLKFWLKCRRLNQQGLKKDLVEK